MERRGCREKQKEHVKLSTLNPTRCTLLLYGEVTEWPKVLAC